MNLVSEVLANTSKFKLVKRWCVCSLFDIFDVRSFKDLKSALKYFRKHDGYYLQKLEVYE